MNSTMMNLTKETLLCYLINELGNGGSWDVTTYLDNDGCWIGVIDIRHSDSEATDDIKYFKSITEGRTV